MTLAHDVTADNYAEKARGFIAANGGKGFVIVQWPTHKASLELKPTLSQWGAWRAYFQVKKINMGWFEHRAYYTVPAEWPHEFDAQATIASDVEHGEDFKREWLARSKRDKAKPPAPLLEARWDL